MIFVTFLFALPNFVKDSFYEKMGSVSDFLPKQKINLGLDLQGGSQLLLEVDFAAYLAEQMLDLQDIVRQEFSKNKIGYRNLKANGTNVSLSLRDVDDLKNAQNLLSKFGGEIKFLAKSNLSYEISFSEEHLEKMLDGLVKQSIEIVRRRVDQTGTTEPVIQRQGEDKIVLQVPGLENPELLKKMLGKTARLSFHLVDERITALKGQVPIGTILLEADESRDEHQFYLLNKKILLTGDLLNNANVSIDQNTNAASVQISFNRAGSKKFEEITKNNVGRLLAIVLDNKVISAANIHEPIFGGNASISGRFSIESASNLALLLRAGALPAPLKIVEERTVGPSLGSDSIESGKKAAIFGAAMVAIFILMTYGVFGLFADIALVFNIIMIAAFLSTLQATLTLPGIAGVVLTIGMAVDANVLIFERIKEEFRTGLSVVKAIDRGFRQAFTTILDSNLTTIIAAFLLYAFGSGSVKGFAVTLTIGILSSMFSAITLTRLMIFFWIKRSKTARINF